MKDYTFMDAIDRLNANADRLTLEEYEFCRKFITEAEATRQKRDRESRAAYEEYKRLGFLGAASILNSATIPVRIGKKNVGRLKS